MFTKLTRGLILSICFMFVFVFSIDNNTELAAKSDLTKTVEKAYKKFTKGKVKSFVKFLADDIVWISNGQEGAVPFAGTFTGKEAVEDYLEDYFDSIDEPEIELQYILVEDNKANVHIRTNAIAESTEKTFDLAAVHATKFNSENKISEVRVYFETYTLYKAFTEGGESHVADLKSENLYFDPNFAGTTQETVDAVYAYYASGNIEGMINNTVSDDVLWILKGEKSIVPYAGVYHAYEGVWDFVTNVLTTAYYLNMNLKYSTCQGNRIDYHVYEELVCIATGKQFGINIVHSFIVNDEGLVTEFQSYNESYGQVQAYTPD